MHRLLCLAMLLHQKAGGVYSINGPTTRHKAALIIGELDDFTNSSIEDSLEDLHAVRKQANRTMTISRIRLSRIRSKIFMLCESKRIGR
ncbi:unnamed protein product [Heligmosomoides polygyrus]|uniref:IstB_IS21 domain-containing protein n=1 Tax=Heligmosomoides polygyrus TaxID=6339 RepID=A0A183GI80_HELPZ|nr:unnamed protein product [Heligmosomoides polygyrus]